MSMNNTCNNCGFYGMGGPGVCPIWRVQREPDDFCSEHKYVVETCDMCRNLIVGPQILLPATEEGKFNIICQNCLSALDTCATCQKAPLCEFEINPDPLPKYIRQQMQDGHMTIVTDVRNPERVRKFCKNCECYGGEDFDCFKQTTQTCSNYCMNIIT